MGALLPPILACAIVAGGLVPGQAATSGQAAGAGQPRTTSQAQGARAAREAYERALVLESDGNHAAALSLLWAAAGAAPADADILDRLGAALERIGALDAAVDAYERALASRPDFTRPMNHLVVALAKAGRGA